MVTNEKTRKIYCWGSRYNQPFLGHLVQNHYFSHISANSDLLELVNTLYETKLFISYDEKKEKQENLILGF